MNPAYRVFVDVTLNKPIADENINMRLITTLPFAPRNGDNIVLTVPDGDETLQLELEGVVYDVAEGYFTADLEDCEMVNNYSENGTLDEREVIDKYKRYGFVRLNFPQGVGRE